MPFFLVSFLAAACPDILIRVIRTSGDNSPQPTDGGSVLRQVEHLHTARLSGEADRHLYGYWFILGFRAVLRGAGWGPPCWRMRA